MRILIAGTGRLGASVMAALLEGGYSVVGLLQSTRDLSRRQRFYRTTFSRFANPELDAQALAVQNRIPLLWLDRQTKEELAAVATLEPDLILTCGFGLIFQRSLLELPTLGCVNVHSSLLPKHRGPSPFAHVILNGDNETGITFHNMSESIDEGDILLQAKCPVDLTDNSATVYIHCCSLAYACTLDAIERIEDHGTTGTPQDSSRATYEPRMTHEAAAIDWTDSALNIERLIRAAVVYHPAWFEHRGRIVRVTRATYDPRPVVELPGSVLETRPYPIIATGEGRIVIHNAYAERRLFNTWPAAWAPLKPSEVL